MTDRMNFMSPEKKADSKVQREGKVIKCFDSEQESEDFIPYRNIAGTGLVTLTVTWCVFDAFAFLMDKYFVGMIGALITVFLTVLTIGLKIHEIWMNRKKRRIFEERNQESD